MAAEPLELRMSGIPFRTAAQDFLREQRLPPQRNQSSGVKIPGMQRPEAHTSNKLFP